MKAVLINQANFKDQAYTGATGVHLPQVLRNEAHSAGMCLYTVLY